MFNLEGVTQKALANQEKQFLVDNNCVVVCPWVIRNGFQNISENGFLPANANPYWYGFFQKIFTGNQVVTATWENSTYLSKVENQYKFKYNFNVGTYYQGAIVVGSCEFGTQIEPTESNQDFIAMKNNSEVTIRFENWVPTEKDMYKLYTIPQMFGGKWYYISNVKAFTDLQSKLGYDETATFNDTSIPACEVTFSSLVDKLQNTGRAVEQYIQYAGIGEPYIIPVVVEMNTNQGSEENQWIEPQKYVSYIPYQPQSANYLQVELEGANMFSGIEIEGRTLTYDGNDWLSSPWKRLLIKDVAANQVNNINRTSLPSRNFFFFPETSVDFVTSKTFQEEIKTREDALAMNQSSGKLVFGKASHWDNVSTGLHKSNPLTVDNLFYDYNNIYWKPFNFYGSLSPAVNTLDHDTRGNFYAASTISYTTNDSFVDILNKNSFIFETQPIIPLSFKSTKPYHISSIPIIGGIVSKLYGDLTINPHTTKRKAISIGAFMDCDVAGMVANIFSNQQTEIAGPLSAIVGDETKASKYLGTKALNTTLCLELTDQVISDNVTYDTVLFGQRKKADGTYIKQNQERFYAYENAGMKPTNKTDESILVIDSITVYALHKGNIRITAFNTFNNPIFTQLIQSKANWTNSIRDWATTITCGGWSDDYVTWTYEDWPWPERPDKVVDYEVSMSFSDDRRIVGAYIIENSALQNNFDETGKYSGNAGAYANTSATNKSLTFTYQQLAIPNVNSKATFKQYVDKVRFEVEGNITLKGHDPLHSRGSIRFDTNLDEAYNTVVVGQYGDQVSGVVTEVLAKNDSQAAKEAMRSYLMVPSIDPGSESKHIVQTGGYSTLLQCYMELTDAGITLSVASIAQGSGYGSFKAWTTGETYWIGDVVENYHPKQWKLGDEVSSFVRVPKVIFELKPQP